MDKKQSLLTILKELFWIFDLAESLYQYIETAPYDEGMIDGLIGLFQSEIESINDGQQKQFLLSIVQKLEQMRQRELIDIKADQAAALRLLELIR